MPVDLETLWAHAKRVTSAEGLARAAANRETNIRRAYQEGHGLPVEPLYSPPPEPPPRTDGDPNEVVEERTALDGRILMRMGDGSLRERSNAG